MPPEVGAGTFWSVMTDLASGSITLDQAVAEIDAGPWLFGAAISQADITTAVAWRFAQLKTPTLVTAESCPALAAFSARAEALPEFEACAVE